MLGTLILETSLNQNVHPKLEDGTPTKRQHAASHKRNQRNKLLQKAAHLCTHRRAHAHTHTYTYTHTHTPSPIHRALPKAWTNLQVSFRGSYQSLVIHRDQKSFGKKPNFKGLWSQMNTAGLDGQKPQKLSGPSKSLPMTNNKHCQLIR